MSWFNFSDLRFDDPLSRAEKHESYDLDPETGEWVMRFSGANMQNIMYAILDNYRQETVGDQRVTSY